MCRVIDLQLRMQPEKFENQCVKVRQFQDDYFCVVFMQHNTNLENLSIGDCCNACCQGVTAGGTPVLTYCILSWSISSICFCQLSETISRDGLPPYRHAHLLSKLTVRSQWGFWWCFFVCFFMSDTEHLILMPNLQTFVMQVISSLSFSVAY